MGFPKSCQCYKKQNWHIFNQRVHHKLFFGRRVYLLGTLRNGLKMSKWSCLSSILDFYEILFLENFSLFPKKQLILTNKSKFGC